MAEIFVKIYLGKEQFYEIRGGNEIFKELVKDMGLIITKA